MELSGLNSEQREAVVTTEGPLLVLAGAGSGKTRVLTHRIAYLISEKLARPREILALTFTNKAAGEMRERVESLVGEGARDMWVLTFHACCARILRRDIDKLGYERSFVIYDDQDQQSLFKRIIKELSLNDKIYTPRMLSSKISDAKNRSEDPEQYLRDGYETRQVIDAYRAYQKQLQKCNAVDFDDLLLLVLKLFAACPDVLENYRARFQYILVDEYQDTNLAQYNIVRLLAERHKNLCVVGDDDQSIYGWRGADIRNILEFERDFPGAKVIRLERNYRSTDAILAAANLVIQNNRGRKAKKLWTDRAGGEPIALHTAADEREEASHICNRILTMARYGGRRYDDIAILYRTHAQSRVLEMYLKSYDIPYRVYGGTSFFQRAEVKDVLAYLALMSNPADNLAFLRVVNVPRRGIGAAAIDALETEAAARDVSLFTAAMTGEQLPAKTAAKLRAFCDIITSVYARITGQPLADTVETLLAAIGYDAYLREEKKENYESRAEVVAELVGYIREFEAGIDASQTDPLAAFLENVALFSQTDVLSEQSGSVSLMTLHSAKGLEFPVVFLTGLEENLFPSQQSRYDPEKLEEERRLMYVGITRAKDELHLSRATQRMLYGKIASTLPSMFLSELAEALPGEKPAEQPAPRQTHAAAVPFSPAAHTLYAQPANRQGPLARIAVNAAAPPAGRTLDVSAGARVRHASYGEGTVLSVSGNGNNQIVEIDFDAGATKKFASAYAPIEKLG